MTTKTITAAEARALLQGTTPGPWRMECNINDDLYVTAASDPFDDVACDVDARELDVRLMAAAPDLAAALIAVTAERDALRAALRAGVRCDECASLATSAVADTHTCDAHRYPDSVDTEHADVVRRAVGER